MFGEHYRNWPADKKGQVTHTHTRTHTHTHTHTTTYPYTHERARARTHAHTHTHTHTHTHSQDDVRSKLDWSESMHVMMKYACLWERQATLAYLPMLFVADCVTQRELQSITWNGIARCSLSCFMQRRGFDPPLGRFCPVEGILPLGLTWVWLHSPKNHLEYKPRSSLCSHAFHRTDSKHPDIHVLDGWMPATKTQPACTIHEDGMWLPLWLD